MPPRVGALGRLPDTLPTPIRIGVEKSRNLMTVRLADHLGMETVIDYAKRFGMVHVDFATQRRTPKLSARWYREVIRANRIL